ncbi:MAG: hypothetical protein V3V19_00530 [Cocleimonas sp.]
MKTLKISVSFTLILILQACSQQQVVSGAIGVATLPVKAGAAVAGAAASTAGSVVGGAVGSVGGPVGSAVGSAVGGAVGGAVVPSL